MFWEYIANRRIRCDRPKIAVSWNEYFKFLSPEVTFVIPVHNQEKVVLKNLASVITHSSLPSEIIILNDASEDETGAILLKFLNDNLQLPKHIQSIQIFTFQKSRFETFCDDFGIQKSKGNYIIEIQADMEICESNFDQKMIRILKQNQDVFMLSARGIMDFQEIAKHFISSKGTEASISSSTIKFLKNRLRRTRTTSDNFVLDKSRAMESILPDDESYMRTKKAGRLGRFIEVDVPFSEQILYIGETVMRGPIAFKKSRYLHLGGLDTESFFLGFDEHDLNLRARNEKEWFAAYSPISFRSPLEHGSMRRKRSNKAKFELFLAQKRIMNNYEKSSIFKYIKQGRISFNDHHKR